VRLALLRLNRDDRAGAISALVQSLHTGRKVHELGWLRTRMGLYLWADLGSEIQAGIALDIRAVWRDGPTAALPYPQHDLISFAHGIGRLDAVSDSLPMDEWLLLKRRLATVLKEPASAS
jgi:hypothetical protein